jgi:predicted dehydrogenase
MRIGIVGLAGHVGDCLKGAAAWKGARIVAVSDPDKAKTAEIVSKSALAADADEYADWRQLIEHAMLDVAIVAGENGERAEQLIALAGRGTAICSEKPLTTTLDDLARVRAAVVKSNCKLTMLLTMRYMGKYRTMRKLIADGAVGEVGLVTSQKSYRFETRPDWQKSRSRLGGTIPYIGVHALDLMRWVPGLDVTHVAAFHANVARKEFGESEDTASVLVRYANGATGTARLDYLLPQTFATHGDDRLRIAGGNGVLETQGAWNHLLLTTADKTTHQIDPGPTENLFLDFLHSVAEDKPCRMTAEDSFSMTELVLKARDAADRKEIVVIG